MAAPGDDGREGPLRREMIFQPRLDPFFRIWSGIRKTAVLRGCPDHFFVADTGDENIPHQRIYIQAVAVCEYQAVVRPEQHDALVGGIDGVD